jgi:hypothetical protein
MTVTNRFAPTMPVSQFRAEGAATLLYHRVRRRFKAELVGCPTTRLSGDAHPLSTPGWEGRDGLQGKAHLSNLFLTAILESRGQRALRQAHPTSQRRLPWRESCPFAEERLPRPEPPVVGQPVRGPVTPFERMRRRRPGSTRCCRGDPLPVILLFINSERECRVVLEGHEPRWGQTESLTLTLERPLW